VGAHECPRLWEDLGGEVFIEHLLAELVHRRLGEAAIGLGVRGDEARETRASEREREGAEQTPCELNRADAPARDPLAHERDGGEAC